MICPYCNADNPPLTEKCECGYKFVTYEISKSELKYKTSDILKIRLIMKEY